MSNTRLQNATCYTIHSAIHSFLEKNIEMATVPNSQGAYIAHSKHKGNSNCFTKVQSKWRQRNIMLYKTNFLFKLKAWLIHDNYYNYYYNYSV